MSQSSLAEIRELTIMALAVAENEPMYEVLLQEYEDKAVEQISVMDIIDEVLAVSEAVDKFERLLPNISNTQFEEYTALQGLLARLWFAQEAKSLYDKMELEKLEKKK